LIKFRDRIYGGISLLRFNVIDYIDDKCDNLNLISKLLLSLSLKLRFSSVVPRAEYTGS
jgi:hypothetical protein